MKALIRKKAGKEFSTLEVQQINRPVTQSGELKVKMVSSRINPVDMDLMKGFPGLKYKNLQIGGIDGAGIVMESGQNAMGFAAGDRVFFYRLFSDMGTWAEEITIPVNYCAKIPNHITTEEAGAIALPLLTAYEGLKQLNAKKGERILVHGAGGGVGFQVLQVAKQMGLYVVGTAGEGDRVELEKAGLDQFIDYKVNDFFQVLKAKEVDYVFDTLGGEVLKKSLALKPRKVVSVKFADTAQMHKTGVHLSAVMNWLIKWMMKRFTQMAKKYDVELMGQVTGANGRMLEEAIKGMGPGFVSRSYKTLKFTDISTRGLTRNDIGKVIIF